MDEKIYVTEEGLQDLKNELETLVHVTRNEVIEELKAARAQCDLSENADYDAARDRQAQVESRIKELEHTIRNAEVITEVKSTKFVRLGSTVEIEELDTKEKHILQAYRAFWEPLPTVRYSRKTRVSIYI